MIHGPHVRDAIDGRLPKKYRGTGVGFRNMVDSVKTRIVVTGVRGKSDTVRRLSDALQPRTDGPVYAKITGDHPLSLLNGVEHPIHRGGAPVMLDETVWEMKRHFPFAAAVVENQGISSYTMRTLHRMVRPHLILVTNIRRDHQSTLGPSLRAVARAIARSIPRGTHVLCAEPRASVARMFARFVQRQGATIDLVPVRPDRYVPSWENVLLVHAALTWLTGHGLPRNHLQAARRRLHISLKWRRTARPGVKWFPAATVNDIDSTRMLLRFLSRRDPRPVVAVAYFRDDRRGRLCAFADFLLEAHRGGAIERIVVAGPASGPVRRRLRKAGVPVDHVKDTEQAARIAARRVLRDTTWGRIATLANGAKPWPRAFEQAIDRGPIDQARPRPRNAPRVVFRELPVPLSRTSQGGGVARASSAPRPRSAARRPVVAP